VLRKRKIENMMVSIQARCEDPCVRCARWRYPYRAS
jgi:hypothetical protein